MPVSTLAKPRLRPSEVLVLKRDKERVGADFGEIRAFLGEGTQFKGVLSFAGAGQVSAEIEVGTLVVSGRVQGSITARERVELLRPSRVSGTIRTPCLVVAEGALFNGNCEMAGTDEASEGQPAAKKEDLQAADGA
jgi:cytoskeletal protein CcmA (bactofilin family)